MTLINNLLKIDNIHNSIISLSLFMIVANIDLIPFLRLPSYLFLWLSLLVLQRMYQIIYSLYFCFEHNKWDINCYINAGCVFWKADMVVEVWLSTWLSLRTKLNIPTVKHVHLTAIQIGIDHINFKFQLESSLTILMSPLCICYLNYKDNPENIVSFWPVSKVLLLILLAFNCFHNNRHQIIVKYKSGKRR